MGPNEFVSEGAPVKIAEILLDLTDNPNAHLSDGMYNRYPRPRVFCLLVSKTPGPVQFGNLMRTSPPYSHRPAYSPNLNPEF